MLLLECVNVLMREWGLVGSCNGVRRRWFYANPKWFITSANTIFDYTIKKIIWVKKVVQHPPKKVVCGRKAIWIDVTMAVGMFLPSTQELRVIIDLKITSGWWITRRRSELQAMPAARCVMYMRPHTETSRIAEPYHIGVNRTRSVDFRPIFWLIDNRHSGKPVEPQVSRYRAWGGVCGNKQSPSRRDWGCKNLCCLQTENPRCRKSRRQSAWMPHVQRAWCDWNVAVSYWLNNISCIWKHLLSLVNSH